MGYSIDVYDHDFEEEVLAKSRDIPVIVDFFATWCGPCQMLKPMLEKVAQEYDCVVAKVDTEQNQFLSQAYRIEGIPDVRIFCNGEIVDGFVGVLPEPQLQELLAKCGIRSRLDDEFAAVRQAMDSGDRDRAENLIARLLEAYPDNRNVLIEAARWLVRLDRLDRAEQLLPPSDGTKKLTTLAPTPSERSSDSNKNAPTPPGTASWIACSPKPPVMRSRAITKPPSNTLSTLWAKIAAIKTTEPEKRRSPFSTSWAIPTPSPPPTASN